MVRKVTCMCTSGVLAMIKLLLLWVWLCRCNRQCYACCVRMLRNTPMYPT